MKLTRITIKVAICLFILLYVLCYYYRNRQVADSINEPWITYGNRVDTKVVLIEGHKYIILDTDYGADIIHAESCNCKSK